MKFRVVEHMLGGGSGAEDFRGHAWLPLETLRAVIKITVPEQTSPEVTTCQLQSRRIKTIKRI